MKPGNTQPSRPQSAKAACLMLALGILLLTVSSVLGESLSVQMTGIYGLHQTHKITAVRQEDAGPTGSGPLTLAKMGQLAQYYLNGHDLAYGTEVSATAVYGNNQSPVQVLGVNDRYRQFHTMNLMAGSFLTPGHENQQVAVIDEQLARSLFGNCQVTGLEIELYERKFTIIGVTGTDNSLTGSLAARETGTVYIPITKLLELQEGSAITFLEAETKDSGTTGSNTALLEEALTAVGQDPGAFRITDYTMEFRLLNQKNHLRNVLAGVVVLGLLFNLFKKNVREIHDFLGSRLREKYWGEIFRKDGGRLFSGLVKAVLPLGGMLALWFLIRFPLYIAPENIPQELIDLSFWADLLENRLKASFQGGGSGAFPGEAHLYLPQGIQNWNLLLSLVLGWPLLGWGLHRLNIPEKGAWKTELFFCTCLISALLLGTGILLAAGMPLAMDGKGIFLVFAAVFLAAVLKGASIKN
ncbi:ABC transporter permease [Desulfitobacterium hafniense]|uniref:ABC transporter permease n=1 Tax=Desulfitobacterium hafniense TaxID=49338 RepID=UPI00037527A3|nr:ABC transporter permease [Desulfitobacterium hafniense]